MTSKGKSGGKGAGLTRERLAEVLDIHGANPARWPEAERAALEARVRRDAEAARLVAHAKALEQVMAKASPAGMPEGLRERVMAGVLSDGERAARVIPLEAGRVRAMRPRSRSVWPAAALAASLAFGIYLGLGDIGANAVTGALDLAVSATGEATDILPDGTGDDPEGLL